MTTAFITHDIFLKHEMGKSHPECPERLRNLCDILKKSNLEKKITWINNPPKATFEQISLAHSPEYLKNLAKISPSEGYSMIDGDTIMNEYSLTAAYYSAGACIHAVDLIMENKIDNAFCATRPPGHHATRNRAMGFCFFNNVAIAGLHAINKFGLNKIVIIDFDVHHGNGTEDIIANNANFLMLSTFEHPLYPYSGDNPLGTNMENIPIPSYGNGRDLVKAVEKWDSAIDKFQPQLILVSAGFDAHKDDNLSTTQWTDKDYDWLTQHIIEYSKKYCQNRLLVILEGGYNLNVLARNAINFIDKLLDIN